MSKVMTTVTDAEAKALEILVKVQDEVLGYVKQAVEFVDGRVSDIDLPFELPEIEALNDILDEIPTLQEVVDTQFAFSKKLLANQEKFAKNLVKTVKPLTRDAKPKARTTKAAAAA